MEDTTPGKVALSKLFILNMFETVLVRLEAVRHYKHAFFHDVNQAKHVTFVVNAKDHVSVCAAGLLKNYLRLFSRSTLKIIPVGNDPDSLAKTFKELEYSVVVVIGHPFDLEAYRLLEGKHKSVFWLTSSGKDLKDIEGTTATDFLYPAISGISGESEWWMAWHILVSQEFVSDEDYYSFASDFNMLSSAPALRPIKHNSPHENISDPVVSTVLFSACFSDEAGFFRKIALAATWQEFIGSIFQYVSEAQCCRAPTKLFRRPIKLTGEADDQAFEIAIVFGCQYDHAAFKDDHIAYVVYCTLEPEGEIQVTAVPNYWTASQVLSERLREQDYHGIIRMNIENTSLNALVDALAEQL